MDILWTPDDRRRAGPQPPQSDRSTPAIAAHGFDWLAGVASSSVEAASELIVVVATGLFAGGALYVAVVEHPARTVAGTAVALAQFPPSYARAAVLQGTSAIVALVAGIAAALASDEWVWALAGGLVGAAVPLTLVVIAPVTHRLIHDADSMPVEQARALLARWAALHALRTALGLAGFVVAAARSLTG